MGNVREVMERIAKEHPLPVKEYEPGGGDGPFTREILEARLETWKQGSGRPFDYCDTDRKNGFRITCPGNSEEGWPDGEAHTDIMDDLTDATIVWVENGWPKFMCRHAHCDEGAGHGKKTWADLQNFYDPERKLHAIEDEEELVLDPDLVEEEPLQAPAEVSTGEGAVVSTRTVKQERARVREAISDIRKIPAKESPAWEKAQRVSELIYASLKQTGKLYNVGNVATYLDNDTREITEVVQKDPRFTELLIEYGIYPSDTNLMNGVGQFLGAKAVRAPKKTIYAGSWYDAKNHILYVNEWHGSILKIDGIGRAERIRNGDDGLLWNDGKTSQADPLRANLEYVNKGTSVALSLSEHASLVKAHILDTILYDETHVTKEQAQLILMTAFLGLFFYERIPSYPMVYFFGSGGSMKTSLAVKVGRLIMGHTFMPTPSTTDEEQLKVMAINNSFLLLDEANNIKKLQNVIKAIATGAQDIRRELYTTANQRISRYQARIWMTANTTDNSNETVSSRMMIIDAGMRTEKDPYRSEHYLNKEWEQVTEEWPDGLRNAIWTETVTRLSAAMRALAKMDAQGQGDIRVSNRMSSFFVFGMAVAKAEGYGAQFQAAMEAMSLRQLGTSIEVNDIILLATKLPKGYRAHRIANGGWNGMRTAEEWASIFSHMVPEANMELKRNAARPGWIKWQFHNNEHALVEAVGMVKDSILTKQKNRINVYGFTKCEGDEPKLENVVEEALPSPTQISEPQQAMELKVRNCPICEPESHAEQSCSKEKNEGVTTIENLDNEPPMDLEDEPKPQKHLCECAGCDHCDPKESNRRCARKTNKKKCSTCRGAIDPNLVEREPVPTEFGSIAGSRNRQPRKPTMPTFVDDVPPMQGPNFEQDLFDDLVETKKEPGSKIR